MTLLKTGLIIAILVAFLAMGVGIVSADIRSYRENFDSYPVGFHGEQLGFQPFEVYGISGVDTSQSHSPPNSYRYFANGDWWGGSIMESIALGVYPPNSVIWYEAYMMVDNGGGLIGIGVDRDRGPSLGYVRFIDTGILSDGITDPYQPHLWLNNGISKPYTPYTWYKVNGLVNLKERTYSTWINDEIFADNVYIADYPGNSYDGWYNTLFIGTWHRGGPFTSVWFDDIKYDVIEGVENAPPVLDPIVAKSIDEGINLEFIISASDPDGNTLTYSASNLPPGATFDTITATFTWIPDYNQAGIYPNVHFEVSDGEFFDSEDIVITVNNANRAPILGRIVSPFEPVTLATNIHISAPFADLDTDDTHTAICNWGDLTQPELCNIEEMSGSGTISASHTYALPGVYLLQLELTDDNGGMSTATSENLLVVYDPNGGFVTGGGWIESPPGAYTLDSAMSGKANFGFVSKYQKGTTVPTGQTQFEFQAADFTFHSTSYDWLVIAGTKAQFKGSGTVNSQGDYGFMLTAVDSTPDLFRLKVWDKGTDAIIYDNKMGAEDNADPTTAISGGSIVVHKK